MKKMIFGLLALASTSALASPVDSAVNSIELGYEAKCKQILRYDPNMKSDDTWYVFKCTKTASQTAKILLNVRINNSDQLINADFQECQEITTKDNFWIKRATCKKL